MLNTTRIKLFFAWMVLFLTCLTCINTVNAAIISGSIYDLSLQKESDVVVEIDTLPKQLFVSKDGDYMFNINPGNYTLYAYNSLSEAKELVMISDNGTYVLDIILEDRLTYSNDMFNLDGHTLEVSTNLPTTTNSNPNLLVILIGLAFIIILLIIGVYLFLRSNAYIARHSNKQDIHDIHDITKHNKKRAVNHNKHNLNDNKHNLHKKKESHSYTTSNNISNNPISNKAISDNSISNNSTSNKSVVKSVIDDVPIQSVTVKSLSTNNTNNVTDEYESLLFQFIKKEKRTTQKEVRKQVPLSEAKISLILTDLESKGMIRKIKKGRGNVLLFVKD